MSGILADCIADSSRFITYPLLLAYLNSGAIHDNDEACTCKLLGCASLELICILCTALLEQLDRSSLIAALV